MMPGQRIRIPINEKCAFRGLVKEEYLYGERVVILRLTVRMCHSAKYRVMGQWSLPRALERILLSHKAGKREWDNRK